MLIEDERIIREILMRHFVSFGITKIEECPSAEAGWEILVGKKAQPFDVVFVDLNLPGISGQGFIKTLREVPHPRAQTIPIIVLTGMNNPSIYKQLEPYRISSYLIKPVSADVLKSSMEKALAGHVANTRPISTVPKDI